MIYGWYVEFEYEPRKIDTGKTEKKKLCSKTSAHGTFTKEGHKFCPTCGSPLEIKEVKITKKGKTFYELLGEFYIGDYTTPPYETNGDKHALFLEWDCSDDPFGYPIEIKSSKEPSKEEAAGRLREIFGDIPIPEKFEVKFGILQD
jgi:hypothetical protein